MARNVIPISILLLISLALQGSSQSYMGTVSTGTGILTPLTVGSSAYSGASVGSLSSQANLTGSWSLDLKGQQVRHFDLQVFQLRDLIQGSGSMSSGAAGQKLTAAGSVAGNRPTIFISFIDQPVAFRLELSASGTSLAGRYDSLSADGNSESGTVTGSMALAAGQSQPTNLGTGTNPSATTGAYVGAAAKNLDTTGSTGTLTESRSFYQTSTGQGTTSSEGTSVSSTYG